MCWNPWWSITDWSSRYAPDLVITK
jgi:hypothetical protein